GICRRQGKTYRQDVRYRVRGHRLRQADVRGQNLVPDARRGRSDVFHFRRARGRGRRVPREDNGRMRGRSYRRGRGIMGKIRINLPTKITIARLALIPLIVVAYCLQSLAGWVCAVTGVLFWIAGWTDFFDGYIARK